MTTGALSPGDPEAAAWSFTADRWVSGSYLWRIGDRVFLSFVYAKDEGKGYLRDLIAGIERAGLRVAVPIPFARMENILKHYGFIRKHENDPYENEPVEVWQRP